MENPLFHLTPALLKASLTTYRDFQYAESNRLYALPNNGGMGKLARVRAMAVEKLLEHDNAFEMITKIMLVELGEAVLKAEQGRAAEFSRTIDDIAAPFSWKRWLRRAADRLKLRR